MEKVNMKNLKKCIENNGSGLHYGNRVLLPFKAHILKAVIENDIITDFSLTKHNAHYNIREDFTEIYFHDYKDLEENTSRYETIKLIVVEQGDSIFDYENHIKLCLHIKANHKLIIEEVDGDVLFIE
jgi:hypothetical protein